MLDETQTQLINLQTKNVLFGSGSELNLRKKIIKI